MFDGEIPEKNVATLNRFVTKASRAENSEKLWEIVIHSFREILPNCCFCVWLHDKQKRTICRWIYEPQSVCRIHFPSKVPNKTEPLSTWFKTKNPKILGVDFSDDSARQFGVCCKCAIRLIPLRGLLKDDILLTICSALPFPRWSSFWNVIDAMARIALQSLERIRAESELQLLNLIAKQANQKNNRKDFLEAIINPIKNAFSARDCSIFLYDDSRRKLVPEVATDWISAEGPPIAQVEYSIREHLIDWIVKRKRAARIYSTKDARELYEVTRAENIQSILTASEPLIGEQPEVNSFLGLPILMKSVKNTDSKLIGVLQLHRTPKPLAFFPEDERFARVICEGLAHALEHWNLNDNDSNLSRSLFEVLEVIHAEVDRDKTLKAIVVGAKNYFGGCAASIFLEEDTKWRVAADEGYEKDPLHHKLTLRSDQGIISIAAQKRRTIAVADVNTDPMYKHIYYRTLADARSEICTPILSRSLKCRGVLSVESDQLGAFRADDEWTIHAIEAFAKQAAVALNRAEVLEERTKWQENLAHVTGIVTTSTVASGLAHELKNGLTIIHTLAEGIQRDPAIKSSRNNLENLKTLQDKSQDLFLLAKRLMDLSKVGEPNKQAVYLNEVVEETVSLLKPIAYDRKLALEVKLDPTLSHPSNNVSGIRVNIDQRQIAQVLTNLILNAMDASHRNQRIVIGTQNISESKVTFTVQDYGKGISPAEKRRIFEMFFTTKPQGFGIGLHVVRFLVNQHGGEIQFSTKLDAGTMFTVTLPKYNQNKGDK